MEDIERGKKESRVDLVRSIISGRLRQQVNVFNEAFDRKSPESKQILLLLFGSLAAVGALAVMINPFVSDHDTVPSIERITTPTDIYPENPMKQTLAQQLIPVGKMKGEIDGKFEAFYIALDNEGKIHINRDPSFGEDRFVKSNRWEPISNEQFRAYEKQLHFIPHKQKGLAP